MVCPHNLLCPYYEPLLWFMIPFSDAPIWDFADYPITNIIIWFIADTDNRSDTYVYHTFACIWQNYHFKNTVLVLFYGENIIKVCKIITDIEKMWLIYSNFAYCINFGAFKFNSLGGHIIGVFKIGSPPPAWSKNDVLKFLSVKTSLSPC